MENQNQNTKVIFSAGNSSGTADFGQASTVQPQSLDSVSSVPPIQQSFVVQPLEEVKQDNILLRLVKRADVILAILLVLGSVGLVLNAYTADEAVVSNNADKYETTQIPLDEFSTSEGINFGTQSVIINGSLRVNDGLIIAPTLQPTSAVAGQMYYDQTSNLLSYYNGTEFVPVSGASGVQSLAGLTGAVTLGAGLGSTGGQLSNTGVVTVQGQTGNVSLTAGNGISIDGTTISNSGVVSVSSNSPTLTVANDGNGNVTLSGSGAGTVNSPGGTSGRLAMFTGAQTIADSIVSQSGMTVTVAGDLAVVTGGLTLSNALTVSNGGTGAASLALNGVLIGQGTGAISSVTAGGAGLCLVSTAGAPNWVACPGGAGVDSLNGLTGALNIANSSGAGSTVTIDDASTSTKGIAQFSATNFSAGAGIVNTVQNINTGATPTFAGVNTNNITPSGALTVGSTSQILTLQGNGGTAITATTGANTTTVGFTAPSADATINFPALSAGSYDICTTSGNCLGGGGGGANTSLSNLTGVAINTTLLPGTAGGVNLGSGTLPFGDLFLAGTSGTPGTNNFRFTGASTGGTRTITIPDDTGTLCLTTGNCAGSGGGVTTAGGTIGTLPVFTGTQAIGDSLLSQSGGAVTINGHANLTAGNQYRINGTQISSANLSNDANLAKLSASQTFTGATNAFQNGANSTNAFNVQNAAGSRLFTIDTSNGEVELGVGSLIDGRLVFNNVANSNTTTLVPGTPTGNRTITLPDDSGIVCLDTGNCDGAGATLQTAYNFSVGGTTPKIKVNSSLGGVDIQDADTTIGANLFNVRASNAGGLGSVMLGVGSTGAVTLQNASNSTTALRVLSSGGTSVLTVDTTNGQTLLGQSGTLAGNLIFRNASNSNTGTLTTAALGQNTTFTLPDPVAGSAEICLNTGNCLGGGGGGANTGLSNLTGVAINTSLLPGSAGAINVGSGTLPFGDLFLAGSSGTPGTNNFRVTGASTGGTRTITLPDASGTVCLQTSASCGFASSSTAFVQGGNSFTATAVLGTNDAFDLQLERGGTTQLTVGNGSVTLATDVDLTLQGANAFISNPQGTASSEAFGSGAVATGLRSVSLGNGATTGSINNSVAIGRSASASAAGDSVVIGESTTCNNNQCVAVGQSVVAAFMATAVGYDASANNNEATALGSSTVTGGVESIALGSGATTTAANQLVVGSSSASITSAIIGNGVTSATPVGFRLQGTSGTGTNIAGASVSIAGGQSTGNAAGGAIDLQISAPGSSGSGTNSLTTVASLSGTNGAATFQNAANSTNAFRILNAAGTGEQVGVDTADSILRLLANNTGHLSGIGTTTWTAGTSLVNARSSGSSVILNGYIYQLGGCSSGGDAQAAVSFSPLRSDGSNGSWTSTTVLPSPSCGNSATTYNGYIYVHGGANNATLSRDVYYAKPNADGTITSWATQNDPTNLADHQVSGMAAYNGYLYITAGQSDDGSATRNRNLYYARINADGSVPSFTVQSNWLTDTDHNPGQVIIANGYLYVMGSSNYDKFFYGRINNDGTVATIAQATGTTSAAKKYAAIAVMNGYMYVIAGGTGASATIEYGALSSTGDIGAFTIDTTTLQAARTVCPSVAPTYNNFVYLVGCGNSSFTAQINVYYASASKIRVGGGLDLTSYSGEGAEAGSSGGQLTAGNTAINGTLMVTGNAVFKDGVGVNNTFSVTGTANVQTTTNTTTGFQVLNASAVPQFVSDTTNSRIYIGNPTSDSTGALLVLDEKNTSGDPSTSGLTSGAMYYNSLLRTFRCYENSAWTDCIGIPKPNTQRTTNMVANGNDANWTGYGDILTNVAPAGSGGSLSSNLVPSVYNDTAASIGSVAGVHGNTIYSGDNDRLIFQTHLDTTQVNVRIWAGFTDQTIATMGASTTPAGSYAAFRYDSSVEATWKCVTRNGVSATVTDSTIAIADDQKFEIVLEPGTRAVFKINGQTVCNVTGTVPDALFRVLDSLTALGAVTKTIYVGWIFVQGDPSP